MIVAMGEKLPGQPPGQVMVIGITEEDIETLRQGLTRIKQGGEGYPFSSLVLFLGKSDEEMIKLLSSAGTVRRDDISRKAGQG